MLTVNEIKHEINHLSIDDKLLLIDALYHLIDNDLSSSKLQKKELKILSSSVARGNAVGFVASRLFLTIVPLVGLVSTKSIFNLRRSGLPD